MALKYVGALWLKDGKKGKFMSGKIELLGVEQDILIFKNDKGGNERRPDYQIAIQEDEEEQEKPEPNKFEDDVPF